METVTTFKLTVTDRNGLVRKHMLKQKPVVNNGIISFKPSPFCESSYVINGLISYSITTLVRKVDKGESNED